MTRTDCTLPHRLKTSLMVSLMTGMLVSPTLISPALAQQAYFRGEAEPDTSVIVNLSVIDRLSGGTQSAPALPMLPAPQAYTQPTPPQASTESAPSSMPQSTLLVPGTSSGNSNTLAATPPPRSVPSAPPPKPSVQATEPGAAPKPSPAPVPAPAETAAVSPVPQSTLEPAAAPEPAAEPKVDPPAVAPLPPPPPPAPEAVAKPAAPAPEPEPVPVETPSVETPPAETTPAETEEQPAVASIDLTAVDTAGVVRNADGATVLFTRDSQDLPGAAEAALAEIAQSMKDNTALTLKLLGYSEKIGDTPSKPRRLSLFRALAVRTFLLKQGIDTRRMTVQALGAKDERNGRPDNRVDLIVSQN